MTKTQGAFQQQVRNGSQRSPWKTLRHEASPGRKRRELRIERPAGRLDANYPHDATALEEHLKSRLQALGFIDVANPDMQQVLEAEMFHMRTLLEIFGETVDKDAGHRDLWVRREALMAAVSSSGVQHQAELLLDVIPRALERKTIRQSFEYEKFLASTADSPCELQQLQILRSIVFDHERVCVRQFLQDAIPLTHSSLFQALDMLQSKDQDPLTCRMQQHLGRLRMRATIRSKLVLTNPAHPQHAQAHEDLAKAHGELMSLVSMLVAQETGQSRTSTREREKQIVARRVATLAVEKECQKIDRLLLFLSGFERELTFERTHAASESEEKQICCLQERLQSERDVYLKYRSCFESLLERTELNGQLVDFREQARSLANQVENLFNRRAGQLEKVNQSLREMRRAGRVDEFRLLWSRTSESDLNIVTDEEEALRTLVQDIKDRGLAFTRDDIEMRYPYKGSEIAGEEKSDRSRFYFAIFLSEEQEVANCVSKLLRLESARQRFFDLRQQWKEKNTLSA